MTVFDLHGTATSVPGGLDVFPAIAHQKTAADVDVPILCRFEQQPWLGLAALTAIGVVVIADTDIVQRHLFADDLVDSLNRLTLLSSPGHVRLVGDHDN